MTGNLPEYAERHDTNKWSRYADMYGPVFLLKTLFNVRSLCTSRILYSLILLLQRRLVILNDPKAMQHIALKDQEIFPKPGTVEVRSHHLALNAFDSSRSHIVPFTFSLDQACCRLRAETISANEGC